MNSIHRINAINEKELESNVSDAASWHQDYADTSYIYVGNLHEKIQEIDLVKIFSQWGNPTHVNLIKDRDSGKSRGFAYLKYEDQRSCVLAVDNFNGVLIYERPLKVDHTYYQLRDGQEEDDFAVDYLEARPAQIEAPKSPRREEKQTKRVEHVEESKTIEVGSSGVAEMAVSEAFVADDDDFNDPMANLVKVEAPKSEKKHRKRRHRDKEGHRDEERKHRRRDEKKDEKETTTS